MNQIVMMLRQRLDEDRKDLAVRETEVNVIRLRVLEYEKAIAILVRGLRR